MAQFLDVIPALSVAKEFLYIERMKWVDWNVIKGEVISTDILKKFWVVGVNCEEQLMYIDVYLCWWSRIQFNVSCF